MPYFLFKFVVHLHPALVNGLLCSVKLEKAPRLFGKKLKSSLISRLDILLQIESEHCLEHANPWAKAELKYFSCRIMEYLSLRIMLMEIGDLYRYIFNTLGKWVKPLPVDDDTYSVVSKAKSELLSGCGDNDGSCILGI